MTGPTGSSAAGPPAGKPNDGFGAAVAVYSLLRIGLVVVVTVLLTVAVRIPFIVSLLLAIIVQLPLSMLLFNTQRKRVTDLLFVRTAERRELRRSLRGDEDV